MLELRPKFTCVYIFGVYCSLDHFCLFCTTKKTLINEEFVIMLMVMGTLSVREPGISVCTPFSITAVSHRVKAILLYRKCPQSRTCSQRERSRANELVDATNNSSYTSHICRISPLLHFLFQRCKRNRLYIQVWEFLIKDWSFNGVPYFLLHTSVHIIKEWVSQSNNSIK